MLHLNQMEVKDHVEVKMCICVHPVTQLSIYIDKSIYIAKRVICISHTVSQWYEFSNLKNASKLWVRPGLQQYQIAENYNKRKLYSVVSFIWSENSFGRKLGDIMSPVNEFKSQ